MTKVIGSQVDDRDISLIAVDQYFRQMHCTETLSAERTLVLLAQVAAGTCGDGQMTSEARDARDRLVEGHQRLVVHIASRMVRQCRSLKLEDLIQEGSIGLMEAIAHYDALVVRSCSAWFGKHIHDAMVRAILLQDAPIHYTHRMNSDLIALRRVEERLHQMLRAEPTIEDVAREMQVSVAQVWDWRACRAWRRVESLSGILIEHEEEEDRREWVSLFACCEVEEDERGKQVGEAVETVLTRRQRVLLRWRYGMDEDDGREQTLAEIAAQWGVCESAVGNMEQRAYERLYAVLAASCAMVVEVEPERHCCLHCGREYPQRFCGRRQDEYCCDKCRGAARRLRERETREVA